MEYLVPRRAPDGSLVFEVRSDESASLPEDERGYPTILPALPKVIKPVDDAKVQKAHRLGKHAP